MSDPRIGTTPRPPGEEEKLDRRLRKLLGKGPEHYTPEQWRGLRELLRVDVLFPGQYVAYRDHREGNGDFSRLVYREVVCAARTLTGLHRLLNRLPKDSWWGVCVSRTEKQ